MTSAIRTDNLTKRYRRIAALDGVKLEVQEGAVYALVGQNGAGKTTAIKILMNLISATGGTADVLGMDSRKIRGEAYTRIGYVSENQEMPEWMRVGALLTYLADFYPTWDLTLQAALIKQFELPLDRKIKDLSRGMKMKLALAGALAFHPPLIVLDEPFGGLDPLVRDQLIEGLLERASESTIFLFARPRGNRKLRQPRRLSRIRQAVFLRRHELPDQPLPRSRNHSGNCATPAVPVAGSLAASQIFGVHRAFRR
jgi:ABC-2 type transport system ATP-binding protein